MNKLAAFVKLDFVTVKPYFTLRTMLIYVVLMIYMATFSESISSGMSVGAMLGTMFIGYPFALGEKCNMDALYVTLALDRKTVVRGRYLYTLALNACTVLASYALGLVGKTVARALGANVMFDGSFVIAGVLMAFFVVIQAVQLPLYFKLGYAKAKFLSIIPFVAIMAGYIALVPAVRNAMSAPPAWLAGLARLFESGMIIPPVLAALALILLCSYALSQRFYKKREF